MEAHRDRERESTVEHKRKREINKMMVEERRDGGRVLFEIVEGGERTKV